MFTYYAPTKLYIGKEEEHVGSIIKELGFKKVLLVYGGGSIKKSGLYDVVMNSLKENGLEVIERGGVQPNPEVAWVRDVINSKLDFDFILAVGGGSVIDAAKSVAATYPSDLDAWEYSSRRVSPKKTVPLGVILTIAAAGSEMSSSCVITNPEIPLKQGFNSDLFRPVFSIMNPELTFSVSKYQTACGIVDIMMHTIERYITKEDSELADEFSIAVLRTVYNNGLIAYNDPTNYKARRELMLASSFSHNGLTQIARGSCMRAHQFEHVLSGVHTDVAHGAGLAVVWPAYCKFIYKNEVAQVKLARVAHDVIGIKDSGDQEKDALEGIIKLQDYFKQLGMPSTLEELGFKDEEFDDLVLKTSWNKTRTINDVIPLTHNEILEIYKLMR